MTIDEKPITAKEVFTKQFIKKIILSASLILLLVLAGYYLAKQQLADERNSMCDIGEYEKICGVLTVDDYKISEINLSWRQENGTER